MFSFIVVGPNDQFRSLFVVTLVCGDTCSIDNSEQLNYYNLLITKILKRNSSRMTSEHFDTL